MDDGLTVDVRALHAALDRARINQGLSWRQLAKEIGVAASTMSRMANNQKPDVSAFAAMTDWLKMSAEDFYVRTTPKSDEEPDLVAQLLPHLRARRDLTSSDVAYLEEIIGAAAKRFAAETR